MKKKKITAKGSGWVGRLAGVLAVGVMLWGCSSLTASPATKPVDPKLYASADISKDFPQQEIAQASDGSLWDERGSMSEMFSNPKARRMGDILTIKIVENSSATNKAGTNTDRNSSMSAGLTNFFNAEASYPSQPLLNPFSSVTGSIDSQFKGTGSTERSGALTAYMTARIVDKLPNGNLVIEGNREVRVNAENQMITLTGVIRPRDITADNVIQSTYIADARISYSGSGVLNDRQRPGWLTRIFDKVWPF